MVKIFIFLMLLTNISFAGVLTRNTTGLLIQEDFSASNGWSAGTGFSRVQEPALVSFGETPSPLLQPTLASADLAGVREGQLFVDNDGTWYMLYDAGDENTGWLQFIAKSTDRGVTWVKQGAQSIGYNNGSAGNYAAVATGWLEKYGSTYYMQRIPVGTVISSGVNKGLPADNFTGDVWTASSILGSWSFVRSYTTTGWTVSYRLPGSQVLSGGTYYMFIEGNTVSDVEVGIQTASSPSGPWTLGGSPQFGSSSFAGPRNPENAKVFYHPTLGYYTMLLNLISVDGTHTDRNSVVFSSSISDWSSAIFPPPIQRVFDPDTVNASTAVGVITHIIGPDGALVQQNGYIPAVYDTDPQQESPGWHIGRSIRGTVLEPAAYRLNYTDATTTRHSYSKTLSHTNFVAEYEVDSSVSNSDSDIAFEFRSDGSSGYQLRIRLGGASNWLGLYKMDGTLIQDGTVSRAGTENGMMMHVRVSAVGSKIDAWLGGEHQIDTTDTTYSSGTTIALSGKHVTANVRLFHMTTNKTIVIRNAGAGATVTLRTFGDLPMVQVTADGSGNASYDGTHFPIYAIESSINPGNDYLTSDNILWGGDDVTLGSLPPQTPSKIGFI